MSKELEAFERIRKAPRSYREEKPRLTHTYYEDMELIETALKEKENMEKIIDELFSDNGKVITTIEIKNKLKAFDLLIKKLDIETLLHWLKEHSTEEEFEFLKEVLL